MEADADFPDFPDCTSRGSDYCPLRGLDLLSVRARREYCAKRGEGNSHRGTYWTLNDKDLTGGEISSKIY